MKKHFKTCLIALFALLMGVSVTSEAWAARTEISVQTSAKWRDGLTTNEDRLTLTAADVSNKNQCDFAPGIVMIIQNSGASPYTYTITSKADQLGRVGDLTQTLAAGDIRLIQLDTVEGFMQDDGKLYFEGSNAAIKFSPIRLR